MTTQFDRISLDLEPDTYPGKFRVVRRVYLRGVLIEETVLDQDRRSLAARDEIQAAAEEVQKLIARGRLVAIR